MSYCYPSENDAPKWTDEEMRQMDMMAKDKVDMMAKDKAAAQGSITGYAAGLNQLQLPTLRQQLDERISYLQSQLDQLHKLREHIPSNSKLTLRELMNLLAPSGRWY